MGISSKGLRKPAISQDPAKGAVLCRLEVRNFSVKSQTVNILGFVGYIRLVEYSCFSFLFF